MLRQAEHLQFRRRRALFIFSFIVIYCIDYSCADNLNNNDENTTVPDTALIHRLTKTPLKFVSEIRNAVAGTGHGGTTSIKEPDLSKSGSRKGVGENGANQKSSEKPVGSANNGGAVQSDDIQSDSFSYQYQHQSYPSNGYGYYQFRG